jgi:hypothetical protein
LFSFSTPEPVALKPQASASDISKSQPPPQSTQAYPSFQPEKKKEGKSILHKFMTQAKQYIEAPSIFSSPKPSPFPAPAFGLPIASTPQPSSNQIAAGPLAPPAQESASPLSASQEPLPLASNGLVKKPAFPPPLQSKTPETETPGESAPGLQADVPKINHAPAETVKEEQGKLNLG